MTTNLITDEFMVAEERREAVAYVVEAFTEAMLAGIDADSLAYAALEAALQELVGAHGEDSIARFVEDLPQRIRHGEFSFASRH